MKVNGNVLIILLTSFIFFQCQTGAEKEKNERLTDEVSRTIKERIAEGITPENFKTEGQQDIKAPEAEPKQENLIYPPGVKPK